MKTRLLLLLVLISGPAGVATAQSNLNLQVLTSSPEGFSVNSVLVTGEKEAVLIDAQFTLSDAHRLTASILESKKQLTTIYITHWHPDHFFGLTVLHQSFPNAKIVARPATIDDIRARWQDKVNQWKPMYGDNLTSAAVIPQPLKEGVIFLEGHRLEISDDVQGDDKNNSYVWVPSLKAVIAGDIIYSGVYPWTRETNAADRREWIKTLDAIAGLKPHIVVAGHKKPGMRDDLTGLTFTKEYLTYFDEAIAASTSADELMTKIKKRFPGLDLEAILQLAADAVFPQKKD
jgi:glyoxylase-like metal-dependent hydrolase (beta-lactamase superfamily II)